MAVDEMMIDGASGTVHCGMRLFRLIEFRGEQTHDSRALPPKKLLVGSFSVVFYCRSKTPHLWSVFMIVQYKIEFTTGHYTGGKSMGNNSCNGL